MIEVINLKKAKMKTTILIAVLLCSVVKCAPMLTPRRDSDVLARQAVGRKTVQVVTTEQEMEEELSETELAAIDILKSRFHSVEETLQGATVDEPESEWSSTEEVPTESIARSHKRRKSFDTTSQGDIKVPRALRSQCDVRMVNKAWGYSTDLLSDSDKKNLSDTSLGRPEKRKSRTARTE